MTVKKKTKREKQAEAKPCTNHLFLLSLSPLWLVCKCTGCTQVNFYVCISWSVWTLKQYLPTALIMPWVFLVLLYCYCCFCCYCPRRHLQKWSISVVRNGGQLITLLEFVFISNAGIIVYCCFNHKYTLKAVSVLVFRLKWIYLGNCLDCTCHRDDKREK